MYAEERQQAIAGLIGQRGRVSVADLADAYEVTTETVRRDLAALDRLGLIRRVHGGAVSASAITLGETGLTEREHSHAQAKNRIAAAALAYLPPQGGSVVLDAGTTTARIAPLLPAERELTVVTNSIPVATRCAGQQSLQVLGGRVRGITQAVVGDQAVATLTDLRVDVAFVGTNALTVDHGLSTPDLDEAAVKRALVRCANLVVVVADSSKIGREDLVRFAPVDAVDVLVTDTDLDPSARTELEAHGIEVVLA
ncbi:DeoR/GlpR family DNA-binding transcription regulator [Rhodococcus maanshanensis]|uniref:Lactose phosphotransferase system repressor n=1 Tax=Rhodococcus maanshanensis TaxID=183556 RepID=A0A1H7GF50_9NOCA|nr:DeoR/GlpR family DNA-binding transcription regulator [Rhodococcus maanshanensis]SEK36751.1 DeoR family transcriptional regulator, fructose operon transcriptional repressor [Rhodococcus maanshanensis]